MLTNHSLNDTETRNEANGHVGGQYTMHVRWVLGSEPGYQQSPQHVVLKWHVLLGMV